MKISSISAAAMTLLAGKASASKPTRLRAMTEEVAANATSASDGITDADFQDKLAGYPFIQALLKPDNATESQILEDLIAEDESMSDQFDLLEVDSSMSMAGSIAASQNSGSIAASQNSNSGGGFGWSSKSGKGSDYCSIEKMRGSYVFRYDIWKSYDSGWGWITEYFNRDRAVLLNFRGPIGPGRGAMVGEFCYGMKPPHAVAVQTGVSQKDVVPFQITVPEYGPIASIQGEYNCKTEEVYFSFVLTLSLRMMGILSMKDPAYAVGFSTRKPAKKRNIRSCR